MTPPFRSLVVAAHPDDIEFGCAGTVAVWVDSGADVTYCIVTDGSTGTQDVSLVGEPLAKIRKVETQHAAEVVGVHEIEWLGFRDGYVEYTLDLRRDIARVFRKVRPQRFVVMDPRSTIEDWFINHPDHRAVGQASLDVAMTAGTTPGHFPELLDEGLQPWRGLRELWVAGPGAKPVAVDITATIDRKIEALLCHESQLGPDAEGVAKWVREWTAEQGRPHGFAHAETFTVMSQGPGFHEGEQEESTDMELARAPVHPPSAPLRPSEE
jgi:LmbE family N-acetylglucosaminyl deacetylase